MKWSIVMASFAIGAIATFAVTKNLDQDDKKVKKDIFDREITIQDNEQSIDDTTFRQDQMAKRMMKIFDSIRIPDFDDSMIQMQGMGESDIKVVTKSDQSFEYIEVEGDDLDPKAINVKIEDGMVSISGRIEKNVETNNRGMKSTSSYVSSFQRSFNIPNGVDENEVSFEPKENKLIIKFKKAKL